MSKEAIPVASFGVGLAFAGWLVASGALSTVGCISANKRLHSTKHMSGF